MSAFNTRRSFAGIDGRYFAARHAPRDARYYFDANTSLGRALFECHTSSTMPRPEAPIILRFYTRQHQVLLRRLPRAGH